MAENPCISKKTVWHLGVTARKSVQPMPENVIQKIPVEAKMMKEVSDMELQTVNATTVQVQSADGNMVEANVSEGMGIGQKYR